MMARKSYDQRLKERWLRKQKKEREILGISDFRLMANFYSAVSFLLPMLFRKRNR